MASAMVSSVVETAGRQADHLGDALSDVTHRVLAGREVVLAARRSRLQGQHVGVRDVVEVDVGVYRLSPLPV